MEYSLDIFNKYLKDAKDARNAIMDLYLNTLYEDNWDQTLLSEFDINLLKYEEAIKTIDELLPLVKWSNLENKRKWLLLYNEVLKADQKAFKLVKIRHEAYPTYRKFRKAIITNLNDSIGFVRDKGKLKLLEVFEYFNEVCANVPLYGKLEDKSNNLYNWFFRNIHLRYDDAIDSPRTSLVYSLEDVGKVFKGYYDARIAVFEIFNMLTSSDPDNGYERYHTILQDFITANIKNGKQLKQLYNSTNIDDEFSTTDDYQLTMDDMSWNRRGIYESYDFNKINESSNWFLNDLNDYNLLIRSKREKSVISKINMIGKDVNACNVRTDGNHVYAVSTFYPDDVIEICPTRRIDKSSLYSLDMRDIVFEVVPNEEWVIPFGYCQYYDVEGEPNCTFIWDPVKRVIVIRAINKIPKLSKLVLKTKN